MTTDEQCVPDEDEVRDIYGDRYAYMREEAVAEFDRFLAHVRRDAAKEAWEKCAVMAAHHGAHDGSRTRWLSSINPYTTTEREEA